MNPLKVDDCGPRPGCGGGGAQGLEPEPWKKCPSSPAVSPHPGDSHKACGSAIEAPGTPECRGHTGTAGPRQRREGHAWRLDPRAILGCCDSLVLPLLEATTESRDPEAAAPAEVPAPSLAPTSTPAPAEEAAALPASSDSERSASSVEGPGGALYARVARREARPARARAEAGGLSLSPSPERRKPPPPDPATKPKVSWIHGKQGSATAAPSPPPAGRVAAPSPSGRKRTPSNTSVQPPGPAEEVPAPAAASPPRARARGRGPGLSEPTDAGGPPRSAPEAASLLAAELRDKTRSLGRAEGPPGPREKPPPPQKAKRSVLPASTARASAPSEATAPEKAAAAAAAAAPETPRKKTPIQKPPRKKSREAAAGEPSRAGATPAAS